MAIDVINTNFGSSPSTPVVNNSISDKDMFLRLLVTQLAYQDPLDPMENDVFTSQLVQLGALEQMENMNINLQSVLLRQSVVEAVSMIGKKIYGINSETEEEIEGVVNRVNIVEMTPYLEVNGKEISLDDVLYVEDIE